MIPKKSQVQHITADIIVLDQLLARYGPETRPIRDLMRRAVAPLIEHIWRDGDSETAKDAPFVWATLGDAFAKIAELAPQTESQRSLKTRATQVSTDLAQTRLALYVYAGNSISVPFLAVLVFWLTITFASFSLFSRLTPTLVVVLFVFVLSASGAIFLVLELSQPFAGLMQISSSPLRNALAPLPP